MIARTRVSFKSRCFDCTYAKSEATTVVQWYNVESYIAEKHLIEATFLTGCGKGDTVLIARIPIIPKKIAF